MEGKVGGSLATILVVLAWFVLNITIGSTTKWIFLYGQICAETLPSPPDCKPFQFPLTITVIHMAFSWVMCHIQLYYIRSGTHRIGLREQFQKVAPLSLCFCLSVGMGNLSLKYIFPSFNQMLGAMSPLITVLLAVVIQRKRYNWWTWASMPIICGGLALCSSKEVNFSPLGAFFATGATVLRALKSIMQGKLLQGEKMDSVTLLYYMSPWAALFLLVLAGFSEGAEPLVLLLDGLLGSGRVGSATTITGRPTVLLLLVVSGMNACLLNVANFAVTAHTSPVTLQVLGNVKNCLAIIVSVAIFRNALKFEQALGVFACLVGVWLYNRRGGAAQADLKVTQKVDSGGTAEMTTSVNSSSDRLRETLHSPTNTNATRRPNQ